MAFISHANKVMLKILQARLQHYVNLELLGLEKAEEPEINCQHWLNQRKQASISASLTMWKPLTVWSQQTGKFLERGEYQTTLPVSWETCRQVKKEQLELDMEQLIGSKTGKGEHQGYILSPCLFNFYAEYIMWNARLDEAEAGIKTARRNINNLRYTDDTTLMAESEEELKSLLVKVKEESEKAKIMASGPITSW